MKSSFGMDRTPTHAQLGAAVRAYSASARRVGDANRWRAAPGSATATSWKAAADTQDSLQFTLTEADVHAVLLVRSALAHADEVGRAVSARQPFLPNSVGRIVVEHALRARFLLDEGATPLQRAERRLDDLLYAVTESERQREEFARQAGLGDGSLGDMSGVLKQVEARAVALGFTVFTTKTGGRRVSEAGRPGTGALAERYLAGEHPGVLALLVRGHAASIHGVETALLDAATDAFDPETGINMPQPMVMDAPRLSVALIGVPLALIATFDSLITRFEWPKEGSAWRAYERDRSRLLETWATAANAADEDPGPTEVALFGTSAPPP